MKIILREDVDNLGTMGETVNVAPGYARNYLIPKKFAVTAESASAKQVEHELRIIKKREEKLRKVQGEYKGTIDGVKVEFIAKASEEGKLFGSVTSLHLAEKLREAGHEVDRRRIMLKEPLKSLGEHEVALRIAPGIEATIHVTIAKDEEAAPEPEEVENELDLGPEEDDEEDDDE